MSFYDQIEIEDFDYDNETKIYTYPCPCGDKFQITENELFDGEDVARCPSCSLMVQVIYDRDKFTSTGRDQSVVFEVSV